MRRLIAFRLPKHVPMLTTCNSSMGVVLHLMPYIGVKLEPTFENIRYHLSDRNLAQVIRFAI